MEGEQLILKEFLVLMELTYNGRTPARTLFAALGAVFVALY